jgi:hypothetical protein
MHLQIEELWSPDLNPPSSGLPPDIRGFCVFMQVALSQQAHHGTEVFGFFVCSPDHSAHDNQPCLCLPVFEWSGIRRVVSGLLDQCRSCSTWDQVVEKLAPQLDYADQ